MVRYLHLFDTEADFDMAYNGSDYHEPWVSLTRKDLILEIRMYDYEGYETIKFIGMGDLYDGDSENMIWHNAYIWQWLDSSTHVPLDNRYMVTQKRPIEQDDIIYHEVFKDENGKYRDGWGGSIYVSSTYTLEREDAVDYNKHLGKYIEIERAGRYSYTIIGTSLTCADLEETGNTYTLIYHNNQEIHNNQEVVTADLVFKLIDGDMIIWGNNDIDNCLQVYCYNGTIVAEYVG